MDKLVHNMYLAQYQVTLLLCHPGVGKPVAEGEHGKDGQDHGQDGQGHGEGDGERQAGFFKSLRCKVASI